MRRVLMMVAVALLAALLLAPGAVAASPLRLTEAGGARFPERSFVLSGPVGASFAAGQIHLRENGRPVSGLSVTPAAVASSSQLGVLLVIDTSGSMKGKPIRAAMSAARALARRRNPQQPLGIITFNRRPRVVLPFTSDASRIDRALAKTPQVAPYTRIYDSVAAAARLIERSAVSAGTLVVLSDGDDGGSQTSLADAAKATRSVGARLFGVGLSSSVLNAGALGRLASAGGGEYTTAYKPSDLGGIYAQLGARFAHEYLLSYRSHAGPGLESLVEARVDGQPGVARSTYLTPEKINPGPASPYHRPTAEVFWTSALATLLVSLLCSVPLVLFFLGVLRPRTRDLRARMARFVSMPEKDEGAAAGLLQGQVLSEAERTLEGTKWWALFKEEIELARIQIAPINIVAWTVAGTLFAISFLYLVSGSVLLPLVALFIPLGVRAAIKQRLGRQRDLFAQQLAENCQVLASAMRAGHSMVGALSVAIADSAEPSRSELGRVVADERLGVPLEQGFVVVARRMASRDMEQVAMVASLQRDTGGNTADVLDRVADSIRARYELKRMIQTLTAQGRMSRWVVTLLPVAVLAMVTAINRDYLDPLYSTTTGHILLFVGALLVAMGSVVIKRIVEIEV